MVLRSLRRASVILIVLDGLEVSIVIFITSVLGFRGERRTCKVLPHIG